MAPDSGQLHLGDTGMRGYDLPAVVNFLEIHSAIPTTFCLGLSTIRLGHLDGLLTEEGKAGRLTY
jgi:hypothetical protein